MSYHRVYFNEAFNTSEFYTNTSATDHAEYCGYAVMMEAASFTFRTVYLNTTAFLDENKGRVPVILNWVVGNETCDVAKKKASYACRSNNSRCIDSTSGPGNLCNCTEGYHGNPYLPGGCKDIDECTVNDPPPCPGHCKNTPGNFSCPSEKPPSSSHSAALILAVGLSLGAVILVITITCTYLICERKKLANIKKKYFQQHGRQTHDIIDYHINTDENAGVLEEVADLASQCLEMIGDNRPSMRDVADKLGRLRKVMQHPWAQHDPEEMESLLGESSVAGLEMVSTGNFSMEGGAVQGILESGR
ncbi:hypothetical protein OsI_21839 [Oryza sativa Indica Group]|uniref:EGF-like calcium-binding domain-containing protein n=1 Tax=Oryza sativa subsp. indica TaxID=39946 RepID=B8B3A4_ORYSI|nr:hypothetical protein OsI_21839 [Oryza sativa Indica Group]